MRHTFGERYTIMMAAAYLKAFGRKSVKGETKTLQTRMAPIVGAKNREKEIVYMFEYDPEYPRFYERVAEYEDTLCERVLDPSRVCYEQ